MRKSALIYVMERAARSASRGLLRDLGEIEQLQTSRKEPADFVGRARVRTARSLHENLTRDRPDFGFLMAEGGAMAGADGDSDWIVDPLNGASNFLHGLPHFAISIAYRQRGAIQAGLIYAPVGGEIFHAEKGKGAFLNDRRMRASARTRMSQALLVAGAPNAPDADESDAPALGASPAAARADKSGAEHADHGLAAIAALSGQGAAIRRFGAAALDLAWLAAGRHDGIWDWGLQPWEVAAGLILVREAGGLITNMTGGRATPESADLVAANNSLHPMLLKTLRAARPPR